MPEEERLPLKRKKYICMKELPAFILQNHCQQSHKPEYTQTTFIFKQL